MQRCKKFLFDCCYFLFKSRFLSCNELTFDLHFCFYNRWLVILKTRSRIIFLIVNYQLTAFVIFGAVFYRTICLFYRRAHLECCLLSQLFFWPIEVNWWKGNIGSIWKTYIFVGSHEPLYFSVLSRKRKENNLDGMVINRKKSWQGYSYTASTLILLPFLMVINAHDHEHLHLLPKDWKNLPL